VPRLQLAAILVSVAGIAVSIYLTMLHYAGVVPACPASGPINCEAVLSSRYALIAGTSIPTSAAGIVWFAISAGLWTRAPGWGHVAWALVGLATVVYLLFVEIVLLGAICLWCTAVHALVVILVLISLSSLARN
jgi:uncharacterized membrane protein